MHIAVWKKVGDITGLESKGTDYAYSSMDYYRAHPGFHGRRVGYSPQTSSPSRNQPLKIAANR
jgi:hypothetical protein